MTKTTATVLLSGGQDSATCLAWALLSGKFAKVNTIGFHYGQRHVVELVQREVVLREMLDLIENENRLIGMTSTDFGEDRVIDASFINQLSPSALTRADIKIDAPPDKLPSTFVPGRNLFFLNMAAVVAYNDGQTINLVGGMCETDYSGYPDCRRDAITAVADSLRLGLDRSVNIHTPLMYLTKRATWHMARDLGGVKLIDLIIEHTHTCYEGDRTHRHAWGYGCGKCPACVIRERGWNEFTAEVAA